MIPSPSSLDVFLRNIQDVHLIHDCASCSEPPVFLYALAKKALKEPEIATMIRRKSEEIPNIEKEKWLIQLAQEKVKEASVCTLARSSLNLAFPDPALFLRKFFSITSLENLQHDAKLLSHTLAPRTQIIKNIQTDQIVERPLACLDAIQFDAILMLGNNDLNYVLRAADIFHTLQKRERIKIYVMGFGGYGTTAGPIFHYSEAATIAERLHDSGIPRDQIVIEPNSTTTEQNIRFLGEILTQEGSSARSFLILGTPMATFRQSRMIEKLAPFPWSQLITYPTDDLSPYFGSEEQAAVNFLFAAREFLTTMYWLVERKNKLSTRPIEDKCTFSQNFNLICLYFERLTHQRLPFEKDRFLTDFFNYMELSSFDSVTDVAVVMRKKLVEQLNLLSTFFRLCFDQQARTFMPRINERYTFSEQATFLNNRQSRQLDALCVEKFAPERKYLFLQ